jgi:hypothetical protein
VEVVYLRDKLSRHLVRTKGLYRYIVPYLRKAVYYDEYVVIRTRAAAIIGERSNVVDGDISL